MQLKLGINLNFCLQENRYVHSVNEWRFNIYIEYLLRSRWKRLPKTCLCCLVFMYLSFGDEGTDKIYIWCRFKYIHFMRKIFVNISEKIILWRTKFIAILVLLNYLYFCIDAIFKDFYCFGFNWQLLQLFSIS